MPRVYRAMYQAPTNDIAVFLRGASDSAGLKQAVTRIVHAVDPELPVYGVRTMPEMMAASLARRRFSLSLMAIFGALALFWPPLEFMASWPMPSASERRNSASEWLSERRRATFY